MKTSHNFNRSLYAWRSITQFLVSFDNLRKFYAKKECMPRKTNNLSVIVLVIVRSFKNLVRLYHKMRHEKQKKNCFYWGFLKKYKYLLVESYHAIFKLRFRKELEKFVILTLEQFWNVCFAFLNKSFPCVINLLFAICTRKLTIKCVAVSFKSRLNHVQVFSCDLSKKTVGNASTKYCHEHYWVMHVSLLSFFLIISSSVFFVCVCVWWIPIQIFIYSHKCLQIKWFLFSKFKFGLDEN